MKILAIEFTSGDLGIRVFVRKIEGICRLDISLDGCDSFGRLYHDSRRKLEKGEEMNKDKFLVDTNLEI